jgi:hypothetical protein
MQKLSPGSESAIKMGCLCPILDNRNGHGAYIDTNGNPVFWFNNDCPLHGKSVKIPLSTELISEDKA